MKDLYSENYKILLKEIREDINRHPVYRMEDLILLDWKITQINLQIQYNLHQNLNDVLCRNRKIQPKTHMELQGNPNTQNKKEKSHSLI